MNPSFDHPSLAPIGLFDSGIGGLTVVRSLRAELSNESMLYVGDTARVPYGIKSEETIRRYAREITRYLVSQHVKMVLIACNTVSAYALSDVMEEAGGIPVIDVLSAGVMAATGSSEGDRAPGIGVMGTLATIRSGSYETAIRERLPDASVHSLACPMLVPLAEEGWTGNEIARLTLAHYLRSFDELTLDRLILGCTHYPLFKPMIQTLLAESHPDLKVIDSGIAIARMTAARLEADGLLRGGGQTGSMPPSDKPLHAVDSPGAFRCVVSDRPQRFQELAERFLGEQLPNVELIRFPGG